MIIAIGLSQYNGDPWHQILIAAVLQVSGSKLVLTPSMTKLMMPALMKVFSDERPGNTRPASKICARTCHSAMTVT